ncbi:MAG TPA: hypothetical protein VF228_05155 [Iamia sp.]
MRRLIAEHGLDPASIEGTGPAGASPATTSSPPSRVRAAGPPRRRPPPRPPLRPHPLPPPPHPPPRRRLRPRPPPPPSRPGSPRPRRARPTRRCRSTTSAAAPASTWSGPRPPRPTCSR